MSVNKVVAIIGGGAGGMTTAAQLKKYDSSIDVVVFEKSSYVAWAGCPTPYFIANELPFGSVAHYTPEHFRNIKGIQIYDNHEVEKINFDSNSLIVKGEQFNGEFKYDELVISTGGTPFTPPIKGYSKDIKGIFRLSHAVDAINIKKYIENDKPKKGVIIGSGFIGIEMAESLSLNSIETVVVEKIDRIFPMFSKKLLAPVYKKFEEKNIKLILNNSVDEIFSENGKVTGVKLNDGSTIDADIIMMTIGTRPNTELIEKSGFQLNENSRVYVDEHLKTYIPNVYALGDMIFTDNIITGKKVYAPFGDVADKQGIVVASNITGTPMKWKGVMGTFATSFFDVRLSKTGLTLEEAKENGFNAGSVSLKAFTKVPGFADSRANSIEVVYDKDSETILGAFMVGYEAVAQFIDQFAIAIKFKLNLEDLFDVDYAYSPTNSTVWNPFLAAFRKILR
ncbi:FAD-dependent oxidoreductase [Haliovirga abyssi]|uniref:NADH oxidase n=1 Tax=Haliovirga abyssi TaxID=2996794 RepID=A0AAU9E0C1_9FUSO|nr:FAD-dependent oxidoreductase [Haliovirga abyssi]BDU51335.1 NADH oxidase [Haliovirga abyssi]